MKKLARILTLPLCAALLTGCLAGCASTGGTPTTTANTTAAAATAAAATTAATVATTAETTATTAPVAPEVSTLSFLVPENDITALPFLFADREKLSAWKEFKRVADEKRLAFEFELIEPMQYEVVSQTRLAAALDLPDIVNVGQIDDNTKLRYAKQNLFQSVTQIVNNDCLPETVEYIRTYYPQLLSAQADPENGEAYWFAQTSTFLMNGGLANSYRTILIRGDWLTDLNLDIPATTNELYDVSVAIRDRDANGNGVIGDEQFCEAPKNLLNLFGGSFGLVSDITGVINSTGKAYSCWYQDGMQDFLKYCILFYNEGLLDLSETRNAQELVASDCLIGAFTYPNYAAFDSICPDKDAHYLPLPVLKARDDIEPIAAVDPDVKFVSGLSFAVTKECGDLAAVGRLFDMLYSDWYWVLCEMGIEGENWKPTGFTADTVFDLRQYEYIIAENNMQKNRDAGIATGYRLWGKGILPRINTILYSDEYYETKIEQYKADGDEVNAYRYQMMWKSYDYDFTISYPYEKYALPTSEQSEFLKEYEADLNTYHAELLINLITGAASLDDWDSYMADFEKLGLPRIVEINQDRYNRYIGA